MNKPELCGMPIISMNYKWYHVLLIRLFGRNISVFDSSGNGVTAYQYKNRVHILNIINKEEPE